MKKLKYLSILLLGLATACASAPQADVAASARKTLPSQRTRIILHLEGDSFNGENYTPANLYLYAVRGTDKNGEPFVLVCSRQNKRTGSRLTQDSCRRSNQAIREPLRSGTETIEFIAALALHRELEAGTVDLDKKLIFLNVVPELIKLKLLPQAFGS